MNIENEEEETAGSFRDFSDFDDLDKIAYVDRGLFGLCYYEIYMKNGTERFYKITDKFCMPYQSPHFSAKPKEGYQVTAIDRSRGVIIARKIKLCWD